MINEYKYLTIDGERRDMSLFGAFPDTGVITFFIETDDRTTKKISLVIHSDGLADDDGEKYRDYLLVPRREDAFEISIPVSELSELSSNGLLYYRYDVVSERDSYSLGGEEVTRLLPRGEHGDRQLLIYRRDFKTPSSFKGGTMYHIFVDRFASSGKYPVKSGAKVNDDWRHGIPEFAHRRGAPIKNNEFFRGDLTGILERLDYIESLGVTVLYLSPVFDSPSNHKYDTSDYMKVDSMFGGDEALSELIDGCERRGIKVVLDGVFNHTGDDSVYFDRYHKYGDSGAYNNPESEYFSWYNFRHYPDDYECWWNIKILPRVDSSCDSFRNFILGDGGVVDKCCKMGVSGFRLDVADELSEVFLDDMRSCLKKKDGDMILIGEVWEDASNKIAYSERRRYLGGGELDSVMNYPLREGVIAFIKYGDHLLLRRTVETVYRHYPKCVSDVLMNFLGTHDTERIITVLAGDSDDGRAPAELAVMRLSEEQKAIGRRLVKCAWSIVATTYGIPSIFYGDEAGLEGYHDPFCRRPFPWGNEDLELEDFFKRFGRFRAEEKLFKEGYYRVVDSNDDVFVSERFDGASSLYTVVTRSKPYLFEMPKSLRCVFDSDGADTFGDERLVPPYTARIFKN